MKARVASPTSSSSLTSVAVQDLEQEYLLGTYAGARPVGISFVKGNGCILCDAEGKEYLDFSSGIAVNCLGHSDRQWTDLVGQQLKVTHTHTLIPFSSSFSYDYDEIRTN